MKISCSLCSTTIRLRLRERLVPGEVQYNSDSSLLLWLKLHDPCQLSLIKTYACKIATESRCSHLIFLAISSDCSCMRQQHMVCCNVRLCGWVPGLTISELLRASTRGMYAIIKPKSRYDPWLVESHPVFHSVPECLETEICIIGKVFSAQRASHSLLNSTFAIYPMNTKHTTYKIWCHRETYMILKLSNPPYCSSSGWGRSKWYRVTYGVIPVHL